ncbi:MAG: EamA family transporter RarD [Planctomycetota bacterium]|nr:EamA family transporter RarD [Planctomycetota bacterium]
MTQTTPTTPATGASTPGIAMALSAFGWWALVTPLYFHVLREIPAEQQLAWRVVSGLPTMLLILLATRRLRELGAILRAPGVLALLLCSACLLAINGFTFTWAVLENRLMEGSLGYYINPLVSVLLGAVFLGERLRGLQQLAVAIAAVGVVLMTIALGHLPWVSLILAFSFGIYGLIRKQVRAAPGPGLTVEMMLMLPVMIGLLVLAGDDVRPGVLSVPWVWALLLLAGPQTVVPLLLYTGAARRITLSTLGLLQFTAPTGQLLLAVLLLGEPFEALEVLAFVLIWIAVLLYSTDTWRRARQVREVVPWTVPEPE